MFNVIPRYSLDEYWLRKLKNNRTSVKIVLFFFFVKKISQNAELVNLIDIICPQNLLRKMEKMHFFQLFSGGQATFSPKHTSMGSEEISFLYKIGVMPPRKIGGKSPNKIQNINKLKYIVN